MSALVRPLDLPAPNALARALSARLPAFQDIAWTESTGSTNADLLTRARQGDGGDKPWLLGTHRQQAGRGRAGRPWQNKTGAALMFSCAFDVHLPPFQLPVLSLLAGLAACEALRNAVGANASGLGMKWPNDIQWHDAKLAGILVETTANPVGMPAGHMVVIGMGINLRDAAELSLALDRQVADWTCITGQSPDQPATAVDLICATATAWLDAIQTLQSQGFGAFAQRFEQIDVLAGRPVDVLDQGKIIHSGIASGVDSQGHLLVHTPTGVKPISVGEISIRLQA